MVLSLDWDRDHTDYPRSCGEEKVLGITPYRHTHNSAIKIGTMTNVVGGCGSGENET